MLQNLKEQPSKQFLCNSSRYCHYHTKIFRNTQITVRMAIKIENEDNLTNKGFKVDIERTLLRFERIFFARGMFLLKENKESQQSLYEKIESLINNSLRADFGYWKGEERKK